MMEPPDSPRPNEMQPTLLDYGGILRGASSLRIYRPGSRYSMGFVWPREPMDADVSPAFVARLQRGKRQGVQMKLPLLRAQGSPGAPVVDGDVTNPATSIAVRGFTAGYVAKEGYWLTISEANGTAYLHMVAVSTVANGAGEATVQIEPPLRAPFADGDIVELAEPFMQGFIASDNFEWAIDPEKRTPLAFVLEEYK